MTTGDKIKRARKYANMTQRQLGIAMGFSPQTADVRIAQYENDMRKPRPDVFVKLAQALQVPIQYFQPSVSETANIPTLLFQMEQATSFALCPADAVGGTGGNDVCIHFENPKDREFLRQWMYMRRNLQEGYIDERGYFRWQMDILSKAGGDEA